MYLHINSSGIKITAVPQNPRLFLYHYSLDYLHTWPKMIFYLSDMMLNLSESFYLYVYILQYRAEYIDIFVLFAQNICSA